MSGEVTDRKFDGFPQPIAWSSRLPAQETVELLSEILEAVALGQPLQTVMHLLCLRAEALAPSAVCSVLLVDEGRLIQPIAGPSLPKGYAESIAGKPIGPNAGSCGAAAYLGRPVEVTDIATDAGWKAYRAIPLAAGLRACWSSPIKGKDERVIGTFALYYSTQRGPSSFERDIVDACVHLASLAIQHDLDQRQIHRLAYYDVLTGLPNRTLFHKHFVDTVGNAVVGRIALLYVDLDDFKAVNDTFGHLTGDDLLRAVGRRILNCVSAGDFVARLSGDEFAVMCIDVDPARDIEFQARAIIAEMRKPFLINEQQVVIGTSIGIVVAAGSSQSSEDLLRNADLALYAAKADGRNSYRFFSESMSAALRLRRMREAQLQKALGETQFILHFQPLVDLASGKVVGFETLLRWMCPGSGLLTPQDFISIAEDSGLIIQIGAWVLHEACRVALSWPDHLQVGVNLSPVQFRSPDLAGTVKAALAETGLEADRLKIEVTETVLLNDSEANLVTLRSLHDLGVRIALDDFGTGYASLSYLQRFAFDRIKIDQSFIQPLPERLDSQAIVRSIVGLAKALQIEITAEGVETREQLEWLRAEGCGQVQGHLLGKPMPAEEVVSFLQTPSAIPTEADAIAWKPRG